VERARQDKWGAFAALVGDGDARDDVAAMFKLAWRVPVANMAKEIARVLAYDAVLAPERVSQGQPCSCSCGAAQPGMRNRFWARPVAQAVFAQLQGRLALEAAQLQCRHLELLQYALRKVCSVLGAARDRLTCTPAMV
jgi:hypothetical protein